ncbi:MAG: alpha/beta hydrolase [Burkholderiaceae bacterium]
MTSLDPDWLDRQYNNRALVPEHGEIFERWSRASALAREKSVCQIDLRYASGPNETLDVFVPRIENAPILVFIHGGYWRSLDKRDVSFVAPSFVQDGAMVVVPNYALCPAVTIDEMTLQLVRSIEWVYRHAASYGADPARIVVVGHSAGGHLAAMMLSCLWSKVARDLPADLVKSAMAISGMFDLEPIRHTPFLMNDLRLTADSALRLSPATFPTPRGVLHVTVGAQESDEFLRQSDLIRSRWGEASVPVCERIAQTNHFTVLHDFADSRGRQHELALQLLGLARPAEA